MSRHFRLTLQYGLIGGVASWHLSLVGLFSTFAERYLVGKTISMGYIIMMVLLLLVGQTTARAIRPNAPLPGTTPAATGAVPLLLVPLLMSGLAGGITGGVLALLALLIEPLALGDMFRFATPDLTALITFGNEPTTAMGIFLPVASGATVALVGGSMSLLPPTIRRTITTALITTLLIALLRDVVEALPPRDVARFFFTTSGLTVVGAVVMFIVTVVFFAGQSFITQRAKQQQALQVAVGTTWQQWASYAVLTLFLLTFPLWAGRYLSNVATNIGLYVIMGLGLNFVIGFAGMLDLGFVAFYAIGAYTMAMLTSPDIGTRLFDTAPGTGLLSFWSALPFSMLIAMLGGTLLALPILKMRGDYLAIATLGFGEIIRILALSDFLKPYMNGAQGISDIPRPELGTLTIKDPQQFYYIALIGCIVAWYIANRLKQSHLGRSWMAIREDEDVAQAMGINRVNTKLTAFVIGAFLGGMSGGISAAFISSVVPKSFELIISINVLALIIVGGMGSLPGVMVGALAMVGLPEMLRDFDQHRMLVYGAVLVLMMLYRPQGLWPEATLARQLHNDATSSPLSPSPPSTSSPPSTES